VVASSDAELPFCSPRCRLLDLGNWASGRYAIPAPISEQDTDMDENAGELQQDEGE